MGDILTLFCAIFYSFYIIIVGFISKRVEAIYIIFFIFLLTSILSFSVAIFDVFILKNKFYLNIIVNNINNFDIINMFYLAIFGSIIPYIMMCIGQKRLNAQVAAIIYLLEPVFAAFIAVLFFNELFFQHKFIGAGIILLAQVFVVLESTSTKIS